MTEHRRNAENITTDKIHIVYIIDHFVRGGGSENQLAALIENLDRSRFTPHVLNLRPKWQNIDIDCEVTYLNVASLLSFRALRATFSVARFLKKSRTRILQVYFFDSRLLGTLAGYLAGVERIVFCRREMGWNVTPMKAKVFTFLARLSDYCLVNAERIKQMVMENERFAEDKIEVIYNGVIARPDNVGAGFDKAAFNIPESSPVLVTISNLRPIKRLDRLIRAAVMLRNKSAHLIIIGTGPLESELKQQALDLGISDRIHLVHTVDGVFEILKFCDIGVLTSESEGLSNALIEYSWAGLPAAAFDVGGNGEVIIDGQTGYLAAPFDEEALADRISFWLDNPADARRMGEAARRLAEEKFNVMTMTRKTESFYLRILGMSSESPK